MRISHDRLSASWFESSLLVALGVASVGCGSDDPANETVMSSAAARPAAGAAGTTNGSMTNASPMAAGGTGGSTARGASAGAAGAPASAEVLYHLYVGCRDAMGSIQHYRISSVTGALDLEGTALANATTSNVAVNADETFVYVAHADEGRISTLSRDPATGALTLLGFVAVPGNTMGDVGALAPFSPPEAMGNPATQTLAIDSTGSFLLASNYYANTVLVYAINPDGLVGDLVQTVNDGTSSHHTVFSADGAFVLVPYFGSNFIATYAFDSSTGNLSPSTPLTTDIPAAGSGPRHLAFDPTEPTRLYSINETAGTISRFAFDTSAGTLTHLATVSSLPDDSPFTPEAMNRSGSEIEIDADGEFLYVSNRVDMVANGSIGVYAISPGDGALTPIEFEDTGGAIPRQFSLSPAGELLVVGNQGSDNLTVFLVDPATGELSNAGTTDVCDTPFFARMISP